MAYTVSAFGHRLFTLGTEDRPSTSYPLLSLDERHRIEGMVDGQVGLLRQAVDTYVEETGQNNAVDAYMGDGHRPATLQAGATRLHSDAQRFNDRELYAALTPVWQQVDAVLGADDASKAQKKEAKALKTWAEQQLSELTNAKLEGEDWISAALSAGNAPTEKERSSGWRSLQHMHKQFGFAAERRPEGDKFLKALLGPDAPQPPQHEDAWLKLSAQGKADIVLGANAQEISVAAEGMRDTKAGQGAAILLGVHGFDRQLKAAASDVTPGEARLSDLRHRFGEIKREIGNVERNLLSNRAESISKLEQLRSHLRILEQHVKTVGRNNSRLSMSTNPLIDSNMRASLKAEQGELRALNNDVKGAVRDLNRLGAPLLRPPGAGDGKGLEKGATRPPPRLR